MKNNTFNSRRFWQVLKWTVISEKKSILTAFVALTVAFLAIQLFSCFTIFDLSHGLGSEATYAGMGVCTALIGFMGAYYDSGVLGNARTSRQRATALMLPASNLEKFTARIVYCCLIMLALLYVAVLTATGVRMLLELIAGHQDIVSGLSMLTGLEMDGSEMEISFFTYLAFTCWFSSLFILGGVFFSKRPFVWTNVTLFVGTLLLFTLFFYIATWIGEDNLKRFFMNFKGMSIETFELIADLVLTAFTVLNIWISYRLFCRLQIVQHKWFNV